MEYVTENHGTFTCHAEDESKLEDPPKCNCYWCTILDHVYDIDQPYWLLLWYRAKHTAFKKDLPFPVAKPMLSHDPPFDPETYEWQAPRVKDVVSHFLTEHDGEVRPNVMMFHKRLQETVLWYVTGGRICANRNKQLFILWNHRQKALTSDSISQLQMRQNTHLWKTLPADHQFETFYRITECCQDVFDELVRILGKYNTRNRRSNDTFGSFIAHRNLTNMPSIKTFRSDIKKDFDHRRYEWTYCRRKLGGNNGFAPAPKPTRIALPCVHKILTNYHSWLPNFRTSKKRQKVLSFD